jgi:hypothetical protein
MCIQTRLDQHSTNEVRLDPTGKCRRSEGSPRTQHSTPTKSGTKSAEYLNHSTSTKMWRFPTSRSWGTLWAPPFFLLRRVGSSVGYAAAAVRRSTATFRSGPRSVISFALPFSHPFTFDLDPWINTDTRAHLSVALSTSWPPRPRPPLAMEVGGRKRAELLGQKKNSGSPKSYRYRYSN